MPTEKRVILYPYKLSSESYKKLKAKLEELGHKCLGVLSDGEYVPRETDFIIGWGSGTEPTWRNKVTGRYLNTPDNICNSINKIESFELFRQFRENAQWAADEALNYPSYTVSHSVAKRWLGVGRKLLARTKVEGKDGSGIVKLNKPEDWVKAALYTVKLDSVQEWRTHVINGKHVAAQLRVKMSEEGDNEIRTTGNGWGLTYDHEGSPLAVRSAGICAVKALGLDFGAVDILWDGLNAYVLEVNTAPELSNYTTTVYAKYFNHLIREVHGNE